MSTQVQQLYTTGQQETNHYYHNVTAIFKGSWSSQNVTPHENDIVNRTLLQTNRGQFHVDNGGTFSLNIKSIRTKSENINYIQGHIRLKDMDKSDSGALLLAEGFHYLNNGSIYLLGAPDGHNIQLQHLLHMLPTKESLETTQALITEHTEKRIKELDQLGLRDSQIWDEVEDHPISVDFGCNLQIFGQLSPIPRNIKMSQLLEYEKELENPQGISTIQPPPLQLSSIMYSPDCGLGLSIENASGIKIEEYFSKTISYATMATILAILQIFLLIHQMEYTPTPSSVSNVSYWTIAMQAMMDGYICLLHLTTGVVLDSVFLPFASAAFFSFILVSIFGMRYLLVIWRIQRPESVRTNQSSPTSGPQTTETTGSQQPVSSSIQSHMDFSRLYAILLFGLFLFYQSTTRSAFIQNIVVSVLGFGFFSFWIPQIIRNVSRGCRKPLSPRYILGMTFTRLAIPLYFYACPRNIISQEPSFGVWVLVVYVLIQVCILFLQDILGPRFFVPEKYLPQTYNYHPILPPEDEETTHGGDSTNKSTQPRDCAICMLSVDTSSTAATGLHVLGRTQYMMTPCHHLFHTDCLEKWMRIKLECPVCRSYLPSS
ncbi:uncharacterized protein BX664DRAFT_336101 [Halteromyces radiatus]|uniref:uncharacterized protein n=1 Tax=Halteromyces radiatus TaxID=101107 RepID=UPI00221F0F13|nr:uncharacterized protein BX664DRAFT_336101 [Halteromyces radiatus]KAI8086537.1 hypothetical protein BX664DRAFT_336101 [Halteromyces radiatus]